MNKKILTSGEKLYVDGIRECLLSIRNILHDHDIEKCDADELFTHLKSLSSVAGNLNNANSFGGCLLAKHYLQKRFKGIELDVSAKPQGANGPDIDVKTSDGKRILAELKTTVPYQKNKKDFGANQRVSLRKDWAKLRDADADYKFFFLTDSDAFRIVNQKYANEVAGIEVILLK